MKQVKLKLGFIGGGINSAVGATHQIAAQMDGRWELVAGCFSRSQEINLETANRWGIDKDRLHIDWQQLLDSEKDKLDAVVILTPTPNHTDVVIKALSQGYAVICEKALAPLSSEAAQIREAVEKNKGFLAVTYNYTGYPMLRELKKVIQKGKIGKINQIHIEMPQEGFVKVNKKGESATPQAWRLKDESLPIIALDLGVHLHHMIHFLSNEKPIEVVALNDSFGTFNQVIDNTMCIARYTGNLSCQIWYSKSAMGHRNGLRVRVYGEQGSAEWYQMQPENLMITDQQGSQFILDRASVDADLSTELRYNRFKSGHPAGFIEAFANHYYDLADSLEEFKTKGKFTSPWVFSVDKAEEGLLMLEAMTSSAKNKCWEDIYK